jgi:hypothetical protein
VAERCEHPWRQLGELGSGDEEQAVAACVDKQLPHFAAAGIIRGTDNFSLHPTYAVLRQWLGRAEKTGQRYIRRQVLENDDSSTVKQTRARAKGNYAHSKISLAYGQPLSCRKLGTFALRLAQKRGKSKGAQICD